MLGVGVSLRHMRGATSALAFYAANGLRPTFVLDPSRQKYFVDGLSTDLAGAVTHSRASGATYLDSTGTLQTAASGEIRDQAYAYVDGVLTGPFILTEPAATNLITYSQDFTDASWVAGSSGSIGTLVVDATGPDGETSATTLIDSGGGGSGQVFVGYNVTVSTSTTYTFSTFAKAGQASWLVLDPVLFTTPANTDFVFFDLENGVVGTEKGAGNLNPQITDFGNGWYRCSITFTTDVSDTTGSLRIAGSAVDDALNYLTDLDGTSSILIYGVQLEEGSIPTSYIPTSGSQGARAEDVLTIPDAPWPEAVTGPELVTNGTFDADSDWVKSGNVSITGGKAVFGSGTTSGEGLAQNIGLIGGKVYQYSFDVAGVTGGEYLRVKFGEVGDTFTIVSAGTKTGVIASSGGTAAIDFRPNKTLTTSNITIDNISVKEISPRAIGISMKGLMTGASSTFADWTLDANNGIQIASGASDFTFTQEAAGVLDSVTGGSYTSGINVPFSIASYHKDNGINGAIDGVALTENTTPTILPDLSATPITIRAAGGPIYLEEMRIWVEGAVDKITDALIEEASA